MKTEEAVAIPIDTVTLKGDLAVPKQARGTVLFAHGSGSGRFSSGNRYVARALQEDCRELFV
jgi:putative phosphoribosyl transferase